MVKNTTAVALAIALDGLNAHKHQQFFYVQCEVFTV